MVELETGWQILHKFRICRVPYMPASVARGLWHTYSTLGLPLGETISLLYSRGVYPDWAYLVVEMCAEGWRVERIGSMICQEIEGVYPPDISLVIRRGLSEICAAEKNLSGALS